MCPGSSGDVLVTLHFQSDHQDENVVIDDDDRNLVLILLYLNFDYYPVLILIRLMSRDKFCLSSQIPELDNFEIYKFRLHLETETNSLAAYDKGQYGEGEVSNFLIVELLN